MAADRDYQEPEKNGLPSLDELGDRINQARGQDKSTDAMSGAAMGNGWRVASELIAALLVAVALGIGRDRVFHTTPLFLLIGIFIGFAAGILNVRRSMNTPPPASGDGENDKKAD